VDRVDGTDYVTTARLESLIFDNGRWWLDRRPVQLRVTIDTPLRSKEFVRCYLRVNGVSTWTLVGQTNEVDHFGQAAFTFQTNVDLNGNTEYGNKGFQHELRVDWGGTGATRAALSSLTVQLDEDTDISLVTE
jgi:hypothetical protein